MRMPAIRLETGAGSSTQLPSREQSGFTRLPSREQLRFTGARQGHRPVLSLLVCRVSEVDSVSRRMGRREVGQRPVLLRPLWMRPRQLRQRLRSLPYSEARNRAAVSPGDSGRCELRLRRPLLSRENG